MEYFNNKIDTIVTYLTNNGHILGASLIPLLEQISLTHDDSTIHRYVLMHSNDITCQRAVALPINNQYGDNYLPISISKNIHDTSSSTTNTSSSSIYLIALTTGSLIILLGMCGLYWRLRAEYAAISKDKVLSGSSSMIQMWKR